jgi:ribosomal protein L32
VLRSGVGDLVACTRCGKAKRHHTACLCELPQSSNFQEVNEIYRDGLICNY